jgi:uncharacterized lipoprotein YajG
MKKFACALALAAGLIFTAGCADEPRHTSTTTTEETVSHPAPVSQTTTQTEVTR